MILNIPDLFFTFAFFSILGWVIEVVYRSTRKGCFINPGALQGPYLPLYGTVAMMLMAGIPLVHEYNIFVKIICYFLITTGSELITGFIAHCFFNTRLWDYSDQRFQYQGYICLKFSICWILLAFALEYMLLPPYQGLLNWLTPGVKGSFAGMVILTILLDAAWKCRGHYLVVKKEVRKKEAMMDTEFLEAATPLLEHPMVKALSRYNHHKAKTRLDHVKEVAWLSFIWGKRLSLDCRAIVRGALLHDLFFYDWMREGPRLHGFRHHNIALANARRLTELSPKEIDIIKRHMWPLTIIPPRYAESLVVCMVDTFCSVRDYLKGNKNAKCLSDRR